MQTPTQVDFKSMQSPWGNITLAANPRGLCGVWFEAQQHFPILQDWQQNNHHPVLQHAEQSLNLYFQGHVIHSKAHELPTFDLSSGTPFQQSVWQALKLIPYGATCSYGQLALGLGKPDAVRAVGAAIGRNPLSILIPCHRVLGHKGQMTGYAGGVWRKEALLKLEAHTTLAEA
jgi:methylated-DNA-[protein]-cysteine S-methyltransferase